MAQRGSTLVSVWLTLSRRDCRLPVCSRSKRRFPLPRMDFYWPFLHSYLPVTMLSKNCTFGPCPTHMHRKFEPTKLLSADSGASGSEVRSGGRISPAGSLRLFVEKSASLWHSLMLVVPFQRLSARPRHLGPVVARMTSASSATNGAGPSVPRPSASLIVINDRNEILLVQRNPKSRSFAGAHVCLRPSSPSTLYS